MTPPNFVQIIPCIQEKKYLIWNNLNFSVCSGPVPNRRFSSCGPLEFFDFPRFQIKPKLTWDFSNLRDGTAGLEALVCPKQND